MKGRTGGTEPLRILLSADAVGGVWEYAVQLSRGLVDAGHTVRLAVIGDAGADRLEGLPDGVDAVSAAFRLEWMPDAGDDLERAADWLSEGARVWGADLVHLNQMAYATAEFGVPTLVVVHSDVLSWFEETRGTAPPPEWDAYARCVNRGLAAADVVAAPSRYQSELTRRHYGRAADRVIHNGLVPPETSSLPRKTPLVVSAGRAWDEAKGMAVLDAAAGLLGDHAPEVHIMGDTSGPSGQIFSPRHAVTHGRVPRQALDASLRRTSLYVGASLYEPFGLAPLEAAFHGAALVLSDIPSFREIWGDCAAFFPPGDARALADVLADLAPDLRTCERLGQAARDRALDRYTAATFTERYLELYAAMRLNFPLRPSCV